jgi:hypothetical protein
MKRPQEVPAPRLSVFSKIRIILAFVLLMHCVGGGAYAQKGGAKTGRPAPPAQEHKGEKPRSQKPKPKEPDAVLSPEEQAALVHLESVGKRARGLGDGILKVTILTKVADALWEYDEVRARRLFVAAFEAVGAVKLDAGQDQRAAMAERGGGGHDPLFPLRSSVLQAAARRDFKLAEELRGVYEKEAAAEADSRRERQSRRGEQSQLFLDMAVALARTEPARAARLVRAYVQSRVDERLAVALLRMREENSSLSDQLFGEALAASAARLTPPGDIRNLAVYVLPTEEDAFLGRDPAADPARAAGARQFLDYVYAALSAPGSPEMPDERLARREFYALRDLLPLFARLQPSRAAFVRERMAALRGPASTPADASAEPARPSVEDLIEKAESTVGTRQRTIAFMRASSAAMAQGDLEKALAAAGKIEDAHERKIQTSIILYQAATKELREGDAERARQYARGIEFVPQRTAAFQRAAQKSWSEKEPEQARALLEEVWEWLGKAGEGPQKVDAMLEVTATMAQYDKERGFDFLEATARALNDTDFSYKPPARDALSVEVHVALDMLDLESVFVTAARADSERAFLIAQSLTKPEASLLAQAVVCRQVLPSRHPKVGADGGNRGQGPPLSKAKGNSP